MPNRTTDDTLGKVYAKGLRWLWAGGKCKILDETCLDLFPLSNAQAECGNMWRCGIEPVGLAVRRLRHTVRGCLSDARTPVSPDVRPGAGGPVPSRGHHSHPSVREPELRTILSKSGRCWITCDLQVQRRDGIETSISHMVADMPDVCIAHATATAARKTTDSGRLQIWL